VLSKQFLVRLDFRRAALATAAAAAASRAFRLPDPEEPAESISLSTGRECLALLRDWCRFLESDSPNVFSAFRNRFGWSESANAFFFFLFRLALSS
jgi:hypothetical protein